MGELDEVITLNSVSIIVAEYIPFGANQIVQLNSNVGGTERVQGGFISPAVDEDSSGTSMEMSPEMTAVDILDYTLTNHINFEAEIRFAEDSGVVQVETFGVSLNAEGTCFYGMQVEAVMDRIKDNISLDHLARLLVDVQQDSSSIVDSIISQYQRDLLDLIFLGDAPNRNKVNLIIANEITPHLTAEEYMDKGEYENELKQVIGDTKAAYDISEHDTLVFGSYGLLVAGPNSRHHEPLLCAYLQFITIDIFMQNYFARLWILSDDMQKTNLIIEGSNKDPTALDRIRYRICKIAEDIIKLEISGMRSQLLRRTTDLKKNVGGASRYLEVLREMTGIVAEDRAYNLQRQLETHAKKNLELQENSKQTRIQLTLMLFVFSALMAWGFLDRLTGNSWTVMNTEWANSLLNIIPTVPFAWFGVSLVLWVFFAGLLYQYSQYLQRKSTGVTTVKIRFDKKVFVDKVYELISTKARTYEDRSISTLGYEVATFTYPEYDWGPNNGVPQIVLEFDVTNSYLLTAQITA